MASYRGQRIGRSDYLSKDSYNCICDRCGFKVKSKHMKMQWNGLFCCDASINNCWESRNPQDFVRGLPDQQSVYPVRPDSNPTWPYPMVADVWVAGLSLAGTGYLRFADPPDE